MWAGDVPFGEDSGWHGSVGGGLRIGFPASTRGVIRIDAAFPVDGSGLGGLALRVSTYDRIGLQRLTERQILRSRKNGTGPDVFTGGR
jgi:hypothetical protein